MFGQSLHSECLKFGSESKVVMLLLMMMMLSQGEPGTRGSSGMPGKFGPGGNTGAAGSKGQKGLHGLTVSNTVGLLMSFMLYISVSYAWSKCHVVTKSIFVFYI